jgi:uncharacterized protein (DUF58 family)
MARRNGRIRLTAVGTGLLVSAAIVVVGGLALRYNEFVLIGIAGLLAVIVAVVAPRLSSAITFERVAPPRFVARGSTVPITVRATTERATPPSQLLDQLNDVIVAVPLPAVTRRHPVEVRYLVLARRRGVHTLGPLLEERTDPFGIASRTVRHDVVTELLVHPRVHALRLPDSRIREQRANSMVPRFSEDPLADFRSLREYQVGDDPRRVHWPSSARTGTLLVRDQFEVRRTSRTVVLETLDTALSAEQFEEAAEIAASICCESLRQGLDITLRTRDSSHPGRTVPLRSRQQVLDLLARVQRTSAELTVPVAALRLSRAATDRLIVIATANSELVKSVGVTERTERRSTIIAFGPPPARPTLGLVSVATAQQFVSKWNMGEVVA